MKLRRRKKVVSKLHPFWRLVPPPEGWQQRLAEPFNAETYWTFWSTGHGLDTEAYVSPPTGERFYGVSLDKEFGYCNKSDCQAIVKGRIVTQLRLAYGSNPQIGVVAFRFQDFNNWVGVKFGIESCNWSHMLNGTLYGDLQFLDAIGANTWQERRLTFDTESGSLVAHWQKKVAGVWTDISSYNYGVGFWASGKIMLGKIIAATGWVTFDDVEIWEWGI
jgi:hypothetical protein